MAIRFTKKFVLAALFSCAIPLLGQTSASVSGVVESSDHAPLFGAVVEIFGSDALPLWTAFTDIRGRYEFASLTPGHYSLRVVQAYSVPERRRNIDIGSSTHAIVNLTLLPLFGAAGWFPAAPRTADDPADAWTWTLRSGVDRPILRWMPAAKETPPALPKRRIRLRLSGASPQFGEGGFRQEAMAGLPLSNADEALLHLVTSTSGAVFVAGGKDRRSAPGTRLRTLGTYRTLPVEGIPAAGRLQVLELRAGEQLALSSALTVQFGAEAEAVFAGRAAAVAHPFVAVHLDESGNLISYRLATRRSLQGLEDFAADRGVPATVVANERLELTHELHQELSVERRMAGMQVEAAYFYDHVVDPVLNGYGDGSRVAFDAGNVLLDPNTGAFRTPGPRYSGGGFHVFATRQWKCHVWSTAGFAEGPAIRLPAGAIARLPQNALPGANTERAGAVLVSLRGRLADGDSGWSVGYRWQRESTVDAVDPFGAGRNAPYLSVALHQPLGPESSAWERVELEFMVQNMLAEGYRPVYVAGGRMLFLAQAPRTVVGGVAFSF